jgi:hypothetical protein
MTDLVELTPFLGVTEDHGSQLRAVDLILLVENLVSECPADYCLVAGVII